MAMYSMEAEPDRTMNTSAPASTRGGFSGPTQQQQTVSPSWGASLGSMFGSIKPAAPAGMSTISQAPPGGGMATMPMQGAMQNAYNQMTQMPTMGGMQPNALTAIPGGLLGAMQNQSQLANYKSPGFPGASVGGMMGGMMGAPRVNPMVQQPQPIQPAMPPGMANAAPGGRPGIDQLLALFRGGQFGGRF